MISASLALQVVRGGSPASLPPSVSLSLAQGETASYAVTVTRSDTGAAEDLTGGQLQFAASRRAGSTPVISRQLTITTAASGLATLELASDDTASLSVGAYVCDVWYTDADGNRYPVTGLSALVLRPGIVTEGLAVTVLPTQTPLARGPGADGVALGDLQVFDGAEWQRLAVGADGQVLTADSAQALDVKWAAPTPLTTKGDLLGRSSSALARIAVGSNGQVLTADSTQANGVRWATPTSGVSWFDVTAYGAIGDGTTDDTSAINAAITAASGGGTVYFPRGTYRVTGALTTITFGATDDEWIRFTGEGSKSRIFIDSNNGAFALLNIGGSDGRARVEIDHLLFRGNAATGSDLQYAVIYAHDMGEVYLHDLKFVGIQSSGASEHLVTLVDCGVICERLWFGGTAQINQGGALEVVQPHHCVLRDLTFVDYASLDGVYYSKTPNGNSYWITIYDPISGNASVNTGTIRLEGIHCDEGASASAIRVSSTTGLHTYSRVVIADVNMLLGAGNGIHVQRYEQCKIERVGYNCQGNNKAVINCENVLGTTWIEDVKKNTGGSGTGRIDFNTSTSGGLSLEIHRCDSLAFSVTNPLYQMRGTDDHGRRYVWCKSTAAITALTLVKAAGGTTSADVTQMGTGDSASQVFGICIDGAGGAGVWTRVWPVNQDQLVVLLSDGAGAISVGDAIGVSAATSGRGKKVTSGNILGRALNTVAATPDAQIFLYLNKEPY